MRYKIKCLGYTPERGAGRPKLIAPKKVLFLVKKLFLMQKASKYKDVPPSLRLSTDALHDKLCYNTLGITQASCMTVLCVFPNQYNFRCYKIPQKKERVQPSECLSTLPLVDITLLLVRYYSHPSTTCVSREKRNYTLNNKEKRDYPPPNFPPISLKIADPSSTSACLPSLIKLYISSTCSSDIPAIITIYQYRRIARLYYLLRTLTFPSDAAPAYMRVAIGDELEITVNHTKPSATQTGREKIDFSLKFKLYED